jgi:hypothetical protein
VSEYEIEIPEHVQRYLVGAAIASLPPEVLEVLASMTPEELDVLERLGKALHAANAKPYLWVYSVH